MGLLEFSLGWMGDLVAHHIYLDDVPQPQRRRWSFDGDGWDIADDADNEVIRISLKTANAADGEYGLMPPPDTLTGDSVLASVDGGNTAEWSNRVRIDSNGIVRVGASATTALLTVDPTTNLVTVSVGAGQSASFGGADFTIQTTRSITLAIASSESIVLDSTAGTIDFVVGGGEMLSLDSNDGIALFAAPATVPSYTVAGVPPANVFPGQIIYVSNESGGAVLAFSDGTNWRRVTDRAIIS